MAQTNSAALRVTLVSVRGIIKIMDKFEFGDFIQVQKSAWCNNGSMKHSLPIQAWINAMYVQETKLSHVVIYPTGEKEEIVKSNGSHTTAIRKAKIGHDDSGFSKLILDGMRLNSEVGQ